MVVPCDPKRTAGFSFPGGLHSYLWVELCSLSQSDRIPDNYNIEQGGLSGVGLNSFLRNVQICHIFCMENMFVGYTCLVVKEIGYSLYSDYIRVRFVGVGELSAVDIVRVGRVGAFRFSLVENMGPVGENFGCVVVDKCYSRF